MFRRLDSILDALVYWGRSARHVWGSGAALGETLTLMPKDTYKYVRHKIICVKRNWSSLRCPPTASRIHM